MHERCKRVLYGMLGLLCCLGLAGCIGEVGPDPLEQPGPFALQQYKRQIPDPDLADQSLQFELWVPQSESSQARELIVFLPMADFTHGWYRDYARHLASHGSIVASMSLNYLLAFDGEHPRLARSVSHLLDYLQFEEPLFQKPLPSERADSQASDPLALVDWQKIAVAGHGLGGKIAFYSALEDARVALVMAIDPTNNGEAPCLIAPRWCDAYTIAPIPDTGRVGRLQELAVPSLIFRAAPSFPFNLEPQFNAEHFFHGLDGKGQYAVPAPATYVDMGRRQHLAWLPVWDRGLMGATQRTMVAFIQQHFTGRNMTPYFTGERMARSQALGLVERVEIRSP